MELDILLKLLLAFFLGGLIGFERELSQKEAGFRTIILITLGSTLLTIISLKIASTMQPADPSRIMGQIVTGIGFLGAGAIIQARFAVHGLTTAASIWVVSAVGITIGCGYYLIALYISLLVFITLVGLKKISQHMHHHQGTFLHKIKVKDDIQHLHDIRETLAELNIKTVSLDLIRGKNNYVVQLSMQTSRNKNKLFMERLLQLSGIIEIIDLDLS